MFTNPSCLLHQAASLEVPPTGQRSNIGKSMWKTHHFFIDFESRIDVQLFMSNRCHSLQGDWAFIIDGCSVWNSDVDSMANQRKRVHWEATIKCWLSVHPLLLSLEVLIFFLSNTILTKHYFQRLLESLKTFSLLWYLVFLVSYKRAGTFDNAYICLRACQIFGLFPWLHASFVMVENESN